jgi:uncharacterized membrane protein
LAELRPHGSVDPTRVPGWRDVVVVALVVVGVVMGLAVLTSLLPRAGQDLVFRTPLAIVVLVLGTVGLLVRIARRRPPPV